jgi:hypothetical protein
MKEKLRCNIFAKRREECYTCTQILLTIKLMTLEKKRLGIVEKKPKQKIEQEKTRSEKQILNTQLGTISSTFSLVEFPNSKKTPYLLRFQKTELPIPLSR